MVAWESMALTSFFLVTTEHRIPEIRRAGFLYLLIAHIGAIAILLKSEFVLLIVGGVFVIEMMSVIVQRFVFKYRKHRYGLEYASSHRVLRRAPLHHHFEERGWSENQVVVRFWILGILCAFLALSTLKVQ